MSSKNKKGRISIQEAFIHTKRGFQIWWEYEPRMVISLTLLKLVTALTPYVPLYITARLVDELAGSRDPARLWQWLAALLLGTAGMGLLQALAKRWESRINDDVIYCGVEEIQIRKLLDMDFCDVEKPETQAMLNEIEMSGRWNGWGLRWMYYFMEEFLTAFFQTLGAIALSVSLFVLPVRQGGELAWLNHPGCTLGMFVLLVAALIMYTFLDGRQVAVWTSLSGAQTNRTYSFFFYIFGERRRGTDARIYAQDEFIRSKIATDPEVDSMGKDSAYAKIQGPMARYALYKRFLLQCFTGVIYLFVALKALGGAFGVGAITQYVGALTGLAEGIADMIAAVAELRTNAVFLRTTYKLLDTPNHMYQGSLTTEKRSDRKYEIEFRDVSFRYPGAETWAVRHLNMKFQVGERLAVVGENGSGKTTFIKLLCRLYDPTEGEILLNGINIQKYRYDNYLDLFSVVFQDFRLLAQPLGQNVAAAVDYDRARAKQCLDRAGFGERLASLPKGLDTCLYRDFEDSGVEISGGESQKIALARVLYQNAPFIVLDEPTAALDPEAEMEVYTKFNDIVEDKTAIYISHRLSSCRFCDEIAVFDNGRMVQQGTHDSLVAEAGGKYQTLWDAQAQYYQKKKRQED